MMESAERELRCLDAAPDQGPAFEDQATITGFGEVGGGNQAVVPSASDDNIEGLRQGMIRRSSARTSPKR